MPAPVLRGQSYITASPCAVAVVSVTVMAMCELSARETSLLNWMSDVLTSLDMT